MGWVSERENVRIVVRIAMSDVVDGLDVDVLIFVRFDHKRRVMWLFRWTRLQICLLYVVFEREARESCRSMA